MKGNVGMEMSKLQKEGRNECTNSYKPFVVVNQNKCYMPLSSLGYIYITILTMW